MFLLDDDMCIYVQIYKKKGYVFVILYNILCILNNMLNYRISLANLSVTYYQSCGQSV